MYIDKYIEAKINLYSINFYGHRMPKENELYNFLSVILLDSVFVYSDNEYYPQIFLEKLKLKSMLFFRKEKEGLQISIMQ